MSSGIILRRKRSGIYTNLYLHLWSYSPFYCHTKCDLGFIVESSWQAIRKSGIFSSVLYNRPYFSVVAFVVDKKNLGRGERKRPGARKKRWQNQGNSTHLRHLILISSPLLIWTLYFVTSKLWIKYILLNLRFTTWLNKCAKSDRKFFRKDYRYNK